MKRWLFIFALAVGLVSPAVADFKDITLGTISEYQQCLDQSENFSPEQLLVISECFEQIFTEDAPPPDPEPEPPGGFAPCSGNQSQAGVGIWNQWCTDEARNFTEPEPGVMAMRRNAEAARNRYSCVNKGVAPPTVGSNRVVMTCDLKFPEDWLRGISLGGQHLFKIGEGPIACRPSGTMDEHLRFDFGCFQVTNSDGSTGNGYRDGFRVLIYEKKVGATHKEVWFPSTTKMPGVFRADTWTPFKADCRYEPATGRCDLIMTIGGTTRTVQVNVSPGINVKLGDSLGWGNTDSREGVLQIRNLQYKTN